MADSHAKTSAELEQELEPFGLSVDALSRLDSAIDWVNSFQQGRLEEAHAQLCQSGPLPEMTSHIRPGPGAPIDLSLRQLQYMIAWTARDRGLTGVKLPDDSTGFRIAVMGGGPSGLAATVRLLEKGHAVNLVEREEKLGGVPALVYDEARLPDPSDEIEALLAPAIQAGRLTLSLGREFSSDALLESHDAVLLATGCWKEPSLGQAQGVWSALGFLKAVRSGEPIEVPPKISILCGGDAAMDAAVVVKKLGAKELKLLFDGPRDAIHWHLPEAWFNTDGVEARFDVHPVGYQMNAEGGVRGVVLEGIETVETDMVIEAMGLYAEKVNLEPNGLFSAGALVNGGASVQQCMQEGVGAADEVDRYLQEIVA
jgi:NADPH-dependent glutamate synthase beta subunit-like oxidoreductase